MQLYRAGGVLFITACVLMLASCAQPEAFLDDPIADHSFTTRYPCAPPCWYGLQPGKSTEGDVLVALKALAFVDPTTILQQNIVGGDEIDPLWITYRCSYSRRQDCNGGISLSRTKTDLSLARIVRAIYSPTLFELSVQQVVDLYGLPQSVYYLHAPDAGFCEVTVVFITQGFAILSHDDIAIRWCNSSVSRPISGAMHVQMVAYYADQRVPVSRLAGRVPWPGIAK